MMFRRLSKLVLNEAIVANPDAIDAYLGQFIGELKFPAAQKWMATKARKHLFNTEALLRQVDKQSVYTYIKQVPSYVEAALNSDTPVFALDPSVENLAGLTNDLNHIVDYMNSLFYASELEPAQWGRGHKNVERETRLKERALAIIPKLEQTAFKDIKAQSEKWFQFVATNRDLSQKQEGITIIKDWGPFYAVTYKNKEALELDGDDLANCLRYSFYEDRIASGRAKIVTIRERSKSGDATRDRAVVAISLQKEKGYWAPNECKGYGNKVPAVQYHRMITQLLNELDIDNTSNDLRGMGITCSVVDGKSRYGSFEDVATVVYDKEGIKILKTDDRIQAGVGRVGLDIRLNSKQLYKIEGNIDHIGIPSLCKILTIINIKPEYTLGSKLLNEYGIVINGNSDLLDAIHPNDFIRIMNKTDMKAVYYQTMNSHGTVQHYMKKHMIWYNGASFGYMKDTCEAFEANGITAYITKMDAHNQRVAFTQLPSTTQGTNGDIFIMDDAIENITIDHLEDQTLIQGLISLLNHLKVGPTVRQGSKLLNEYGIAFTNKYQLVTEYKQPALSTEKLVSYHVKNMSQVPRLSQSADAGKFIPTTACVITNKAGNFILMVLESMGSGIHTSSASNPGLRTMSQFFGASARTEVSEHTSLFMRKYNITSVTSSVANDIGMHKLDLGYIVTPDDVIRMVRKHGLEAVEASFRKSHHDYGFLAKSLYFTPEQNEKLAKVLYKDTIKTPLTSEITKTLIEGREFFTERLKAYQAYRQFISEDTIRKRIQEKINKKIIEYMKSKKNTIFYISDMFELELQQVALKLNEKTYAELDASLKDEASQAGILNAMLKDDL